ncbi:MAG: GNAT family N-acetyltransferase [Fluviicola sp.]|jgi:GNAT superfamily N-acetyltransferase
MFIQSKVQLTPEIKEQIRAIWNNEYPLSIAHATLESFENYLSSLENPTHFLVLENDSIVAWGVTFDRENERWFALIIDRNFQGKGFGKELLQQMKLKESFLNGWVVIKNDSLRSDGTPYPLPLDFYLKNGFQKTEHIFETEIFTTQKITWTKI